MHATLFRFLFLENSLFFFFFFWFYSTIMCCRLLDPSKILVENVEELKDANTFVYVVAPEASESLLT